LSLDDFPFWTAVFAPIALAFQRIIALGNKINSNENRITALETNQEVIKEKVEKIDDICNDMSYIKGLLDEHLKK
jgi:hypothetical protein